MNIFIFHRDLRLHDNRGLIALAKEEQALYLFFIFTTEQTKHNALFNSRTFQVMLFCLQQLTKLVHINFISAKNEAAAVEQIIREKGQIHKIFTNKDFTPYALARSAAITALAKQHDFIYREFYDYTLCPPFQIKKSDRTFYQVFTPYWRQLTTQVEDITVLKPPTFTALKWANAKKLTEITELEPATFDLPLTRNEVKATILTLSKHYVEQRNQLKLYTTGTTHISAAIKFGVISIREVHAWAVKHWGTLKNPFSRQVGWHDFFYQAVCNAMHEKTWQFGDNWIKKMDGMTWENNKTHFERWKNGATGVPLVDAGMHELNQYGTMHNRVRMVCASYLVKNLNIDWRWGERYFAQKLLDYDPIVNQCSWQWVAGTGFDAQTFVRIFNPYLQQTKFDPDLVYIHHFLPNPTTQVEMVDYKASYQAAKARYYRLK